MNLPDERDVLRAEAENILGRRIVLRAVHAPEPTFLGRITDRGPYLLIEYRDETSGYFWDLDVLRTVLGRACAGECGITLYEGGRTVPEPDGSAPAERPQSGED